MDDVEEGSLLGIKNYEEDLEEKVWLIKAQNPGTAQYDKLSQDLEQNQSADKKETSLKKLGHYIWHKLTNVFVTYFFLYSIVWPCVFGLRDVTFHAGQGGSQTP